MGIAHHLKAFPADVQGANQISLRIGYKLKEGDFHKADIMFWRF